MAAIPALGKATIPSAKILKTYQKTRLEALISGSRQTPAKTGFKNF
jgi:hypothetical protein